MTGNDTNETIILATELDTGRLSVDREAFRCFDVEMTLKLRSLVKRWKPYAAPRARRITRRLRRYRSS